MNVATIAYLPPAKLPFSKAFRENIRQFKTAYPVLLFSDTPDDPAVEYVMSPERFIKAGRPFVVSNYCFLKAMQMATKHGIDWMILMEADCRVNGDHWDKNIMDEFKEYPDALVGGTPVCWNLNLGGRILTMKIIDYAAEYQKRNGIPMALHGIHGRLVGKGHIGVQQPCLYPNGAAAVYSMEALRMMFPGYMDDNWSAAITAWDMHIGYQMHNLYGDNMTEKSAPLSTVFSGYGDEILTTQERRDWLSSGKVAAVHQIKDDWKP